MRPRSSSRQRNPSRDRQGVEQLIKSRPGTLESRFPLPNGRGSDPAGDLMTEV